METTLYTLVTTDPDGEPVRTQNHTWAGALRLALTLKERGYGPVFEFKCEVPIPVPDALLCPCSQPGREVSYGSQVS